MHVSEMQAALLGYKSSSLLNQSLTSLYIPTYLAVTRLDDLLDFGQLLKPFATINLPKSPTFLGNFCKGVKIFHFSSEIIFGQLWSFKDIWWFFRGHTAQHHHHPVPSQSSISWSSNRFLNLKTKVFRQFILNNLFYNFYFQKFGFKRSAMQTIFLSHCFSSVLWFILKLLNYFNTATG